MSSLCVCLAEHPDRKSIGEAAAGSEQLDVWISRIPTIANGLDGTTVDTKDAAATTKLRKEATPSHSRADRSEVQLQLPWLQQGEGEFRLLFTRRR